MTVWPWMKRSKSICTASSSAPRGLLEEHAAVDAPVLIANLSSELLPDWSDDWVTVERERFRLLALSALEQLSSAFIKRSRFTDAVEFALAAVRLEPLRESAHRALIRAHIAHGNVGEALRQYRIYEDLIRAELGIGPSVQMYDLMAGTGLRQELITI